MQLPLPSSAFGTDYNSILNYSPLINPGMESINSGFQQDWAANPMSQGIPATGSMPVPGTAPLAGAGLGLNLPTLQLGLGTLGTLGGLYASFKGLGLAKKQFRFEKQFAEQNMANQIKSYNTALEDRARSRGVVEGQTSAETQAYIDKNRMVKG